MRLPIRSASPPMSWRSLIERRDQLRHVFRAVDPHPEPVDETGLAGGFFEVVAVEDENQHRRPRPDHAHDVERYVERVHDAANVFHAASAAHRRAAPTCRCRRAGFAIGAELRVGIGGVTVRQLTANGRRFPQNSRSLSEVFSSDFEQRIASSHPQAKVRRFSLSSLRGVSQKAEPGNTRFRGKSWGTPDSREPPCVDVCTHQSSSVASDRTMYATVITPNTRAGSSSSVQ